MASSNQDYPFSLQPVAVDPISTAHRRIVTSLPAPESLSILRTLLEHEPRSMAADQLPVVWDRASGYQVYDPYGNHWIDFTSGIFVANVGHSHPRVVAAIREMIDRPLLHNYYFPSEIRARFVARLLKLCPAHLDAAFVLTTGSETTECAIKLSRVRGRAIHPQKTGIVSLTNGFHGKTMGAQQAGGRSAAKAWIGSLDAHFHQLPLPLGPNCPFATDESHICGGQCFERGMRALADTGVDLATITGFLLEPYQGWSAAFLPDSYVQAVRGWATENEALLIFDEVQSGFGRTGKFLAHEYFGVDADLVCCGKGIGGGLPLSVLVGRRDILDADPSLNSTHGGNPIACAAGLATLDVIQDEGLAARAASLGSVALNELQAIARRYPDHIGAVHGRGLVWGIHLIDPELRCVDTAAADSITEQAMRKGVLLVRTGVGTIKIGPPLMIPVDALVEGIRTLGEAIGDFVHRRNAAA
jgi:4-aminobutyrate aminotransferase/(S)-3-amino-2-methylpropionate transaminase